MDEPKRRSPLATAEDLRAAGVRVNAASNPDLRTEDILERYRAVPNNAVFLFTSEDRVLDHYIRSHWAALDGMSGEICDIHVCLLQLNGEADAYTQLKHLSGILGLDSYTPLDLPALHIWSDDASLRVSLHPYETEQALRDVLRVAFTYLSQIGRPLRRTDIPAMTKAIKDSLDLPIGTDQVVTHAQIGRDVVQTSNYFYGERATMTNQPDRPSDQTVKDVKLSGDLSQATDSTGARQSVERLEAHDLKQSVSARQTMLRFGSHSAYGVWAVVALTIIIVAIVVAAKAT